MKTELLQDTNSEKETAIDIKQQIHKAIKNKTWIAEDGDLKKVMTDEEAIKQLMIEKPKYKKYLESKIQIIKENKSKQEKEQLKQDVMTFLLCNQRSEATELTVIVVPCLT